MMHGEVQTYFMPLEDFYNKFGYYPPKHPEITGVLPEQEEPSTGFKTARHPKNWSWGKITLDQYLDLKKQGKLDSEIIDSVPYMSYTRLKRLKTKWGLVG